MPAGLVWGACRVGERSAHHLAATAALKPTTAHISRFAAPAARHCSNPPPHQRRAGDLRLSTTGLVGWGDAVTDAPGGNVARHAGWAGHTCRTRGCLPGLFARHWAHSECQWLSGFLLRPWLQGPRGFPGMQGVEVLAMPQRQHPASWRGPSQLRGYADAGGLRAADFWMRWRTMLARRRTNWVNLLFFSGLVHAGYRSAANAVPGNPGHRTLPRPLCGMRPSTRNFTRRRPAS